MIAKYLIAVAKATKTTVKPKFFFLVKQYMANNKNKATNMSLWTQAIPSIKINGFSP